jgi:oxygen-independent coproporphyrinogen III oxidase
MHAMTTSEGEAWRSGIADLARRRYVEWDLDALPKHLRRNSLDYYYLSVWPGLRSLEPASASTLPARPARTEYGYVHIPFCSGRCDFCSYFLTVTHDPDSDRRMAQYLQELVAQAGIHQQDTELALSYLYFGGGTPSLVHPDQFAALLSGFDRLGVLSPRLIGTIELHPELFDDSGRMEALLDVLDSYRINRVSLGFQSPDADLLQATNRRHEAEFLAAAIDRLRTRRFAVNIDLMYGLPGQTLESWLRSLQVSLGVRPDSVSVYFTFVDFGTKLWRAAQRDPGLLAPPGQVQLQHLAAQAALEESGYVELPNDFYSIPLSDPAGFVQETLPSDANSLALGAGAYGYYPGVQYFNQFDFPRYSRMVGDGEVPVWRAAVLTPREELCRDIMFSLKNSPMLRPSLFVAKHGVSPLDSHPAAFGQLADLGLVQVSPDTIRLTPKGRLVVEEIACIFAPPRRDAADPESGRETALLRKHHFAPTYSTSTPGGSRGARDGG